MKTTALITAGFLFIIFASITYAECSIDRAAIGAEQQRCSSGCSSLSTLIQRSDCVTGCNRKWSDAQDQYNRCLNQEREQKYLQQQQEEQRLREQQAAEQKNASQAEKNASQGENVAKEEEQDQPHISSFYESMTIVREGGTLQEHPPGTALKDGDTINTGPKGPSEIELTDGHTLTLAPKTSVTYSAGGKQKGYNELINSELLLLRGKFRAYIKKHFGKMVVITPVAANAVRGTDVIFEHNETANITKIYLHEGIVDANDTNGVVYNLNAGETITLGSSGMISRTALNEEDWNDLVNSIETGEEPVQSQEKALQPEEIQSNVPETQTETKVLGKQKSRMTIYSLFAGIVVAIVIGTIVRARMKKTRKK